MALADSGGGLMWELGVAVCLAAEFGWSCSPLPITFIAESEMKCELYRPHIEQMTHFVFTRMGEDVQLIRTWCAAAESET